MSVESHKALEFYWCVKSIRSIGFFETCNSLKQYGPRLFPR